MGLGASAPPVLSPSAPQEPVNLILSSPPSPGTLSNQPTPKGSEVKEIRGQGAKGLRAAKELSPHRPQARSESPSTQSSASSDNTDEGATSVNTIFPRRKAGQHTRLNSKPVVLNDKVLGELFNLPLHEAAGKLGISATAMKSACRKLGIKKWPYRTVQSAKSSTPRSSPSTPKTPKPAATQAPGACPILSKDAELFAETMALLSSSAPSAKPGAEGLRVQGSEGPKNSVAALLN